MPLTIHTGWDLLATESIRAAAQAAHRFRLQDADAQDLGAELFIRAATALKRRPERQGLLDDPKQLRAYLRKCGRNGAIDMIHARQRWRKIDSFALESPLVGETVGFQSEPPNGNLTDEQHRTLENRDLVQRLRDSLPKGSKEALVLDIITSQRPLDEVAAAHGVSVRTLQRWITQGIARLRIRVQRAVDRSSVYGER